MKDYLIEFWNDLKIILVIVLSIIVVEILLRLWDHLADILELIT